MKNTLIYLIGFSGTGKLTIAKALCRQIPAVIIDNQLINDPVFTAIEADGKSPIPPSVWAMVTEIREAVLNTVSFYGKPDSNFIFTNELFEGDKFGDNKLYQSVENVATQRQSLFIPVHLTCSKDELLRRVVREDRKQKRKCIDANSVAENLDQFELLKPNHANALALDVTSLPPEKAAAQIIRHATQIAQGA